MRHPNSSDEARGETSLNVIVCVKQVYDPEAPPSAFKVDEEKKKVIVASGISPVLNPFDENALEAALGIKGIKLAQIKVISLGRDLAEPVLRKCLAVGADELILLKDNAFGDLDSYSTAYVLSTAIRKLGPYDLILSGTQASDTNAGIVNLGIAEILGIPAISLARRIEITDNKVKVERILSDGWQVVETPMPALVTVTPAIGELRTPGLKELIEARKRAITTWQLSDLGVEPSRLEPMTRKIAMRPPVKFEGKCQIVSGGTPEAAGENLALELRRAGLL